MNPLELKHLSEQYREAKDYADLLAYPPFHRLMADFQAQIDTTLKSALYGFETPQLEHDALVRIRTFNELLEYPGRISSRLDNAKKRLEESGVALDPPV